MFDPDSTVEYIPESERGNTKDPFTITIKPAGNGAYSDYIKAMIFDGSKEEDQEKRSAVQSKHDIEFFTKHVKGFKNLVFSEALKAKLKKEGLTEVEGFFLFDDRHIVSEVLEAVSGFSKLSEGQIKN